METKTMDDELFYEVVTILYDDGNFWAKKHLVNVYDENECQQLSTFKGILEFFGVVAEKACSITLILEQALYGEVWRYSYENNEWFKYGTTRGYV